MLVCHCKRISDGQVRAAIRAGAQTPGQVARACGAGTGCGGCSPSVQEILSSERTLRSSLRLEPGLATAIAAR